MRKIAIIRMLNDYYLGLSSKNEAARTMKILKKPWRSKLITRIMKKQWDNIKEDAIR